MLIDSTGHHACGLCRKTCFPFKEHASMCSQFPFYGNQRKEWDGRWRHYTQGLTFWLFRRVSIKQQWVPACNHTAHSSDKVGISKKDVSTKQMLQVIFNDTKFMLLEKLNYRQVHLKVSIILVLNHSNININAPLYSWEHALSWLKTCGI